jgi:hypothetical protein
LQALGGAHDRMADAAAAFVILIAPIYFVGRLAIPTFRNGLGYSEVGTTKGESGRCQMRQPVLHCGPSRHKLLKLATSRLTV